MRKVSKSNKLNFIVFGIMTALIISVFLLFITKGISNKPVEIQVSVGTVTYDEKDNHIKTNSDGVVKQFWDGSWKLELKDKTHSLGKNNVLYDPKANSIVAVGNIYKVLEDASVVVDDGGNTIKLGKNAEIYKMADRKYIVLSQNIGVDEDNMAAKKYVMVDIDKNGSAHVYNNEMSRKFLDPINIVFGEYKFNVAEEFLNIGEQKIDMAKIGGTTNEYFQIAAGDIESEEQAKSEAEASEGGNKTNPASAAANPANTTNTTNSTTNSTNSSNSNVTNVGGGIFPGGGGGGGTSGNTVTNNNPGGGGTTNNSNSNRPSGPSSGKISSIIPDVQGVTVNFSINDIENRYNEVSLDVKYPDGTIVPILIRKEDNYRTIYDLEPNSKYEISLYAITRKVSESEVQTDKLLLDKGKVETKAIRADFSLTTLSKDKLSFNLKIKDGLILSKGEVVLYGDDNEIGRKDLNAKQATDGKGWESSFVVEDISTIEEFKLVLENTELNDKSVNVNSARVFVNSFFGNIMRILGNIFGS